MTQRNFVLLHYHIFKNAGTSWNGALADQFKSSFLEFDGPNHSDVLSPDVVFSTLVEHREKVAFSSHQACLADHRQALGVPFISTLLLRDPITRIRSIYSFERKQVSDNPGAVKAKELDFRGYVEWRLEHSPVMLCNSQTFFCGRRGAEPSGRELPEAFYNRATENLEGVRLLGTVERYDESLAALEQILRYYQGRVSLKALKLNTTQKRISNGKPDYSHIENELGAALVNQLIERNQYDFQLLERANARLDDAQSIGRSVFWGRFGQSAKKKLAQSNKELKVAVVANCQGRPISELLELCLPNLEVTYTAIVHLLKPADREHFFNELHNADLVIAQWVNDQYPREYCRTNVLRELFSDKLIVISNLYFRGQNPDLFYLRSDSNANIEGPLGPYHSSYVLREWLAGKSVDEIAEGWESVEVQKQIYGGVAEQSLQDLRSREREADVKISDYIEAHWKNKLLFYTFNHPTNELLVEYVYRLAGYIKSKTGLSIGSESNNDSNWASTYLPFYEHGFLELMIPAKSVMISESLEGPLSVLEKERLFKGCSVSEPESAWVYTAVELVGEFANLYAGLDRKLLERRCVELGFSRETKVQHAVKLDVKTVELPPHPRISLRGALHYPEVYVRDYVRLYARFGPNQSVTNRVTGPCEQLGSVLDLFTLGASVFTHWLFDLLPKIKMLNKAGVALDDFDCIVVNALMAPYQRDTLERLGVDLKKVKLVASLEGKDYFCERLVRVDPVRLMSATSLETVDWIRELCPPSAAPSGFGGKYYLSRDRVQRRKVLNEGDVQKLLLSRGYKVLYPEDYSLCEIHGILSEATSIVAPHGASLANIMFCPPKTRVLELYGLHLSQDYLILSNLLDLNYSWIECPNADGLLASELELDYQNNFMEINGSSFSVDLAKLESLLD
ncbi:MAG: WcbI family polysaccharide biosynthesis putative acetyltransferase [Opitutales bacterium]|nr:WcbI family polysaccharide biosynthesis putative acetyltransferase [Opitutales bacterium]